MPVPGLDAKRCAVRNKKAARRGFNSAPVRLSVKAPEPIDTSDAAVAEGLRLVSSRGTLPGTKAGAIERINQMLGADAEPLTLDQVWLVYLEAGNSNFIDKYQMHLADSTLRNIARRASKSIAFMNSHRTGGMSTPAEQPYGRTFAGRWEKAVTAEGRSFSRTLVGVYMLRGELPNGDGGPSTDALYRGIKGGTLFDVSLGIQGGDEICDICGNALEGYDEQGNMLCSHVPGTHRNMTKEQIADQLASGVPKGVASFTLEDATAGEVSSVYDGAVPGAGFRKALSLSKSRQLSNSDLEEARLSFAPLLGRKDFLQLGGGPFSEPDRGVAPQTRGADMAKSNKQRVSLAALTTVLSAAGIEIEDDEQDDQVPVTAAPPARPAAAAQEGTAAGSTQPPATRPAAATNDIDDRLRALEEQNRQLNDTLTAEREERERREQSQRKETALAQAANWADSHVRLGTAIPAERDELVSLYAQAAMDDATNPAKVSYRDETNTPKLGNRVQALSAVWAKRGRHNLGDNTIVNTEDPLTEEPAGGQQPLVNLAALPNRPTADPIGDSMVAGVKGYQNLRNGHKK